MVSKETKDGFSRIRSPEESLPTPKPDMKAITKFGAYVLRGGSCAAQGYRIDNVRIQGYSVIDPLLDSDGDGLSDLWEIQNGLDPNDPSDAVADAGADGSSEASDLVVATDSGDESSTGSGYVGSVGVSEATEEILGVVLKWDSVAGRTYSVWRSTDPSGGFTELYTGIPATAPMNEYEDSTATNDIPYYYSIRAE